MTNHMGDSKFFSKNLYISLKVKTIEIQEKKNLCCFPYQALTCDFHFYVSVDFRVV